MTHAPQAQAPQPPMETESVGSDRHEELIQQIGSTLLAVAPPGWRRIDLKAIFASTANRLVLTVIMPDGDALAVAPPPQLTGAFVELRQLMYQPGIGTWFSVRFTMDPPSKYHVSYNFDHDPLWNPPIPPIVFGQDLQAFPRDEQNVPGWLRAKLAGGT